MAGDVQQSETRQLFSLLGGKKVFKREISTPAQMREVVRSGLPYKAIDALLRVLDIQRNDLANVLGIAPRTLARRKGKSLNLIESDRLMRVAYMTVLAQSVLGSRDKAIKWLSRSNRALAGVPPMALLDTEIGERQVEDVLNRINYGIYS